MNDLRPSDVLQHMYSKYGDRAPSYQTLHRRTVEGRCPAYRLGGQWRFREADLDAICAAFGLLPLEAAKAA